VLGDPDIGGFGVRTLLNAPEHVVREAVAEFFADRRPDDLLLLHFSCHGVKDEGGELYFAASNTKLRLLGATAVAAEFVNRCMSRSRSRRVVLLLDCCYAGAFERGMVARADRSVAIEERFGGRGRAVITASSAMEYAFEGDELADGHVGKPSLFTRALVDGLESGDADRDLDGYVGLDELYDYVYDRVREGTPNQTPGKWTVGVQGDLFIARRGRPVSTPAPLPAELQQAIDHPLAGVRAAAVRDLERLLGGTHAGMVLAARLALERLTEDDSRMVSSAAGAALDTAAHAPPAVQVAPPPVEVMPPPVEVTPPPVEATPPPVEATPPPVEATPPPVEATPPPVEAAPPPARPEPPPPTPEASRILVVAGGLGIAAAVLLLAGLLPDYYVGFRLADYQPTVWTLPFVAVLAATVGTALLVPRTRRLAGPGLTLGAALAASTGLIAVLIDWKDHPDSVGPGLALVLGGYVAIELAAVLVLRQLAAGRDVRVALAPPSGALPWLIVLLAAAGAVLSLVLLSQDVQSYDGRRYVVADAWSVVLALLVPVAAVMAMPRLFGAALLGGWIAGTAIGVCYGVLAFPDAAGGTAAALVAGILLAALAVAAFALARDRTAAA